MNGKTWLSVTTAYLEATYKTQDADRRAGCKP